MLYVDNLLFKIITKWLGKNHCHRANVNANQNVENIYSILYPKTQEDVGSKLKLR